MVDYRKLITFTTLAAFSAVETRHVVPLVLSSSMAGLEAARLDHTDPEGPQFPDYLRAVPMAISTSTAALQGMAISTSTVTGGGKRS